jgi:spore coat protein E
VNYVEPLPVIELEGERLGEEEVVAATVTREPEVVNAYIRRGGVQVEVELEFYVEIVGETKLWVRVYEPPFADDKKDKAELDLYESEDFFDEDEFDEIELDDELTDIDDEFVP